MTTVLDRHATQYSSEPSASGESISPVLIPLLACLDDPVCAAEASEVLTSAANTATSVAEPALRGLLVKLADYEEREVCELSSTVSLREFCVASMKISDRQAVIAAAPIEQAIAAAADVCVITFDLYASSGQYRGGVRAAARAVNMVRVQARMLSHDLVNDLSNRLSARPSPAERDSSG